MQYPVLLLVFNRPEHTKKTLEALLLQKPEKLFIFQDGPRDGNDQDRDKCNEVRRVIENEIAKCNYGLSVETCFSDKNKGCRDAIIYAISTVLSKYEAVIVVEDDIITSPAFLSYMNKALLYYKNRNSVYSISGHSHSPQKFQIPHDYDYDVWASPRLFNWGWGTWADRWFKTDWSMSYYDDFMSHKYQKDAFCRMGDDMIRMLVDEKEGRSSAWDIQFTFAHFKDHAVSIVPCFSYTYNIGCDGSGTHCYKDARMNTILNEMALNTNVSPKFLDVLYFDKRIINRLYSSFCVARRPLWQKIINFLYRKFNRPVPFCVKKKIFA